MGARYYSGGRRRFLWNTTPTVRCPWYVYGPTGQIDEAAKPQIEKLQEAVGPFGLDAEKLLRSSHRSTRSLEGETHCPSCGAKLVRVGFQVWVEARYEDLIEEAKKRGDADEASSAETSLRMSARLGFDGFGRVPGSTRYFPLRREAKTWCYEQSQIERAARRGELQEAEGR